MPHTISIGRGATNDIILNQPAITRQHAIITFGEDGSIIYTDNSTNGTSINGQFVRGRSTYIRHGDEILLPGNVLLSWNTIDSRNPYRAGADTRNQPPVMPAEQNNNNDYPAYDGTAATTTVKRRNVCGLLSLIFSLVAIPFYCPPITLVGEGLSTVAFILGFIGLFFRPRGKAIAGLIISLIIPLIIITCFLAIIGTLDSIY